MNVISQIIEEKFPKANHTLYMDDLRIMTESSEEMGIIHCEIKEIISGIGMEMNEKKSGMVLKTLRKYQMECKTSQSLKVRTCINT
ncbi:Reverse transcriptase (RNA-dependent DNA polymerase), putative [Entamoeba histolytica]